MFDNVIKVSFLHYLEDSCFSCNNYCSEFYWRLSY